MQASISTVKLKENGLLTDKFLKKQKIYMFYQIIYQPKM